MAQIQLQKISTVILTPATPEASEFLQRIKIGEWIHADFKRVRNYQLHKKFIKLLQLGYEYWTPTGGAISEEERLLVNGLIDFFCKRIGQRHNTTLLEATELYLSDVAIYRTKDIALLKSFDAFRSWVTVKAGYYTEHVYPDGSRDRRAKSISFANMDELEFQQLYKSALNVLWNFILFRAFSSQAEVENIAAQLLEYAA